MSMKDIAQNTINLPSDYQIYETINLNKDKKINIFIQALLVIIIGFIIGLAIWFNFPIKSSLSLGAKIFITAFSCVIYMIMHELTHGVFFKMFSGIKPTYSVSFPFLCTGSTAYLNKISYIIVGLAPVIIWGIILIALLLLLPPNFFLCIYIVTGLNFAGAAGDYSLVYVISRLSPMALIQDNGTEIKVFMPEGSIMNHECEIQSVIDKFYAIISGNTEAERNWNEFRSLFLSGESSLASMKYNAEKECITKRLDVESYIMGLNDFLKRNDFYEYGFNYEIKVFGSIADVYSEYAAKRSKEDNHIIKRGVNLVQLIHDGQTWKIHSMLWQDQG